MKSEITFAVASVALVSAFTLINGSVLQQALSMPDFKVEGRISNGNTANLGEFPYNVRLRVHNGGNSYVICGGSLIGQEWIVTAARCVHGLGDIYAYLGMVNHHSNNVTITVPNSNAIIHPDWNNTNLHNDIAVIKIPAVTYSNRIQHIQLPPYSSPLNNYANADAIIVGWGTTSDGSFLADDLQYANVQILSQEECSKKLDLIDSMICTNAATSTTCVGDSGGPLVSNNILVGVITVTAGSCNSDNPSVSLRITSFLWWIKKVSGISY